MLVCTYELARTADGIPVAVRNPTGAARCAAHLLTGPRGRRSGDPSLELRPAGAWRDAYGPLLHQIGFRRLGAEERQGRRAWIADPRALTELLRALDAAPFAVDIPPALARRCRSDGIPAAWPDQQTFTADDARTAAHWAALDRFVAEVGGQIDAVYAEWDRERVARERLAGWQPSPIR